MVSLKNIRLILLLGALSILLNACADSSSDTAPGVTTATLIAVGDNLIHESVYQAAEQENGHYDFSGMYTHIKPYIQAADLAAVNQETILVADKESYSGYPDFGTPTDICTSLLDTGFNIITHATNHAYDKGQKGITDTLAAWKSYPQAAVLGIHSDQEDSELISTMTVNGIKFALLNYTYGVNGDSLPKSKSYLIDFCDNQSKMIHDILSAEKTADVTVCFLHIGEEYRHTPSEEQRRVIENAVNAGADIIICAHPHVVQPYELLRTEEGNAAIVYYSLGNFLSGQTKTSTALGGMAKIVVRKATSAEHTVVDIPEYTMLPLVTHIEENLFTVYPLAEYTDELAQKSLVGGSSPEYTMDYLQNLWIDVMEGNTHE